jgi:hypothetical protein
MNKPHKLHESVTAVTEAPELTEVEKIRLLGYVNALQHYLNQLHDRGHYLSVAFRKVEGNGSPPQ